MATTQDRFAVASPDEAIAALGLTISATFVPFSQSRNAKPGAKILDRSLNWKVTFRRQGHDFNTGKPCGPVRDILTTDYMAGIAHCPSVKRHNFNLARPTLEAAEAIEAETEGGREWPRHGYAKGPAIEPSAVDVIYSLVMDASVLDHSSFEDWAGDLGYDTDSRKAETIYRACLKHALALRNSIGEAGLAELRDAFTDY